MTHDPTKSEVDQWLASSRGEPNQAPIGNLENPFKVQTNSDVCECSTSTPRLSAMVLINWR